MCATCHPPGSSHRHAPSSHPPRTFNLRAGRSNCCLLSSPPRAPPSCSVRLLQRAPLMRRRIAPRRCTAWLRLRCRHAPLLPPLVFAVAACTWPMPSPRRLPRPVRRSSSRQRCASRRCHGFHQRRRHAPSRIPDRQPQPAADRPRSALPPRRSAPCRAGEQGDGHHHQLAVLG